MNVSKKGEDIMKLTQEQQKRLQDELAYIHKAQQQMINEIENYKDGLFDFQLNDSIDAAMLSDFMKLATRKKELEEILEYANIIRPADNKSIQIGSSFDVDFGDGIEHFTLVETLDGITQYQDTISVNCEFGKSVLAKTEQDSFAYQTPSGKVEGVITKVYSIKTKRRAK